MTFNTHLRRYRFLCVPFGLKMSQDIFQMRMDDIVAQCPRVLAIHNDVFIYRKDDRDHDANIINLFNVAQRRRTRVQQQEVHHKTRVHNILWWSVLGRRILPWSREDPRHLWDDTTPDEARATIIPRSSELPPDIHSPSQFKHWTTTCPPQKKENCFAWDENTNTLLPENQVPVAESPPQTPEILWLDQTSHPPVWCLTQGAGSLHHSRQTAHHVCQQIPHRHWDPLRQHQERTLGHRIWLWKVPYIPVQKDIHHGNGPQAPRDDQLKESHSGPHMTPENAPLSAAIWPGHNILTRQRNASGRCP